MPGLVPEGPQRVDRGQVAKADEAWRRGAELARRAGDERELFEILAWRASAAPIGPTPVPKPSDNARRFASRSEAARWPSRRCCLRSPRFTRCRATSTLPARSCAKPTRSSASSGGCIRSASSIPKRPSRCSPADRGRRRQLLLRAYDRLDEMGEKALLATTAAMLGESLYAQDRLEEAERSCRTSRNAAVAEDLLAQVEWRGVQAKILARSDRHEDAEALAREAVELVAQTDLLHNRGNALLDLGEVLRLGGQTAEAGAAVRAGLELYEQKGDRVSAARARSKLEAGARSDIDLGGG